MNYKKDIPALISDYQSRHGLTDRDFGELLAVSHTTVARWRNGTKPRPSLMVGLQRILQAGQKDWPGELHESDIGNAYKAKPTLIPESIEKYRRVPVLGIAQAATFNPAAGDSITAFLDEFGDSTMWEEVEDGCMLLRVEGNSMLPVLSPGAILHIDTRRFPRSGEMVVVRLASREMPLVKYYDREKNVVYLMSVNDDPDCLNIEISLRDPGEESILWMYPVTDTRSKPPTKRYRK